jgi:hypothetical protein
MRFKNWFENIEIIEKLNFNLIENKIYPNNIINNILSKINDFSEESKNKLAIFGLFRQQPPFNKVKDVSKIQTKEELDELFNLWFEETLRKLNTVSPFLERKDLAKKYLEAYTKNIKSLGNNAKPFSIKNIEKEFVDIILNNQWIKENKKVSLNKGIYSPNKEDVQYEDSEIIIIKANNKAKCVSYGAGESWCITKNNLNYYNTYRIEFKATIYFVLQKNIKGNEHKLVILNYRNEYTNNISKYSIADRTNADERNGSFYYAKDWSQIELEIPNLKGKEIYFQYIPIAEEELNYQKILKNKYSGDDLMNYINQKTKNLIVNNSEVTPEDFIRDYVAQGFDITEKQFQSLNDNLISSLIESGYNIEDNNLIFNLFNEKHKKRYLKLAAEYIYEISQHMFMSMSEDLQKKYILGILENDDYDISSHGIEEMLNKKSNHDKFLLAERIVYLIKDKLKYFSIDDIRNDKEYVVKEYYNANNRDSLDQETVISILDGNFDYYQFTYDLNFELEELDYYINQNIFKKLIEKAIELELITEEDKSEINNFEKLIPYIKNTEIEENLINIARYATESSISNNIYEKVLYEVNEFIENYIYFIVLNQNEIIDSIEYDFEIDKEIVNNIDRSSFNKEDFESNFNEFY